VVARFTAPIPVFAAPGPVPQGHPRLPARHGGGDRGARRACPAAAEAEETAAAGAATDAAEADAQHAHETACLQRTLDNIDDARADAMAEALADSQAMVDYSSDDGCNYRLDEDGFWRPCTFRQPRLSDWL
jgi:hypothetical protein